MSVNPYKPNSLSPAVDLPAKQMFVRGPRKGPSLYIVLGALTGIPISMLLLMRGQALGFIFPLTGAIVGAFIYRFRSRNWPIDPTARARMLIYAFAVVAIPTSITFILSRNAILQRNPQGIGMVVICFAISVSLAFGMLFSGPRRDGQINKAI